MTQSLEQKLQHVLDRIAIEDCLYRYCHAVDRCDLELLKTVYWEDAIDAHGPGRWTMPASDFAPFIIPVLSQHDQTMHAISNVIIRVEGNKAYAQSYIDCLERRRPDGGPPNDITFLGRYIDQLEKRGEEWRIIHRQVVLDTWRIYDDASDWAAGVDGEMVEVGKRGAADPSWDVIGHRLTNEPLSNAPLAKWAEA